MTLLLLCRHGRTDWNDLGRYQGQTDVPLNALGRQEAELLAESLSEEPIEAVYSSDLSRAAETAGAIARAHGLPLQLDARFREINQGRWEGLTVSEIRALDPDRFARWESDPLSVTLPAGESLDDVHGRAMAAVRDIVRIYPNGLVCVVTHKVVLTIIHCELTGAPLGPALRHLPATASVEKVAVPWVAER